MVSIVIEAEGFEPVQALFAKLEQHQMRDMLRAIGLTIEEQTINHFAEQAGPSGAWPPRKGGGPALIRTGILRGSIGLAVGYDEVEVGTNVFYGKFHQLGTRRIPQRAFLGPHDRDLNELQGVIEDYVDRLLGG